MVDKVFRVSDLIAKNVSFKGRIDSIGKLGPDDDPDDFSPLSPWIMLGVAQHKMKFLDYIDVEKLDIETLDSVALDVGRAVVASKFVPGTAQCSVDMPTCARNERISPLASQFDAVTNIDLGILRNELELSIERIDRIGKID